MIVLMEYANKPKLIEGAIELEALSERVWDSH